MAEVMPCAKGVVECLRDGCWVVTDCRFDQVALQYCFGQIRYLFPQAL